MRQIQPWIETSRTATGDFKIFSLDRVKRISPRTGLEHSFIQLDAPTWINILPITRTGDVLFVHQYRHGIEAITMEIPGGMVDPGEVDPQAAAERELLEETGFSAETIIKLGVVEANPAFMTNHCHLYLGLGAHKTAEPRLDTSEDIAIDFVPLDQLDQLVLSGRIQQPFVICAIYFFNQWRTQNANAGLL